ncbi:MAG: GerMN domain-containing protein [Anaerolineae bacterium]
MPTSTPVPGTTAKYTVTLHYYNRIKGEEIGDPCSPDAVLPIEREIPGTTTPIQDTIRLLIEGDLTEEERAAGFSTEFPHPQFKLLGASLEDGILTLEFADPAHFTVGGSCRVLLLRAQFEKTAKQFVGVEEVRFEPEFLFQP